MTSPDKALAEAAERVRATLADDPHAETGHMLFRPGDLRKLLAHYDASRWRSMDSAPKDGTQILTAVHGDALPVWWQQTTFWNANGEWDDYPAGVAATHWMTLPRPPEEEPK